MKLSLKDKARIAMRSDLRALTSWYAARGFIPFRYALALQRSGRRFRVSDQCLGRIAFEVIAEDAYRMHQRRLEESDVVIDIGGYLGFFGLAAHACGSRKIVSFEAQRESFDRLARNYESMPGAEAIDAAVFRSDPNASEALSHPGTGSTGSVLFESDSLMQWSDGLVVPAPETANPQQVQSLALDDILEEYDRVRLLKLDCEGSEFPILLTSRLLERVDEIIGECHDIPPDVYQKMTPDAQIRGMSEYRMGDLTLHLEAEGFEVEIVPLGPTLHMFFAMRR